MHEGTPVKAMMDGEVTLAENDMYFTGGTLIFDVAMALALYLCI